MNATSIPADWKRSERWYSPRLETDVRFVRWGHWGEPVLLFPTAGGDAEEVERFHLIGACRPLIEAGRIKIYSVDSVAGRAWMTPEVSRAHCAWLQNQFDGFVAEEVLPAIDVDCGGRAPAVLAAGCSIGAFNALAVSCRHPERFRAAICMSGTYDLERFAQGALTPDFYFSSPLHWLPNLGECETLERLRSRFMLLAFAGGRWEDPTETWRMADVLGARGVPNRVDPWGPEYDHDWPTWRAMLPHYLDEIALP